MRKLFTLLKTYVKKLGPGLITGASDDDPSGIGTYAQTGAAFGYAQLWTALFTLPMMIVIQEACARIALKTGTGLAGVLRRHYPRPILYGSILLLVIANTLNAGADLGAMAASAQLLVGFPFLAWLLAITAVTVILQIFIGYRSYARILRILTLSLLSYVFVVLVVPQHWGQALKSTVLPTILFTEPYWLNLVALFGTTISPYLFFWQADEEVEERIAAGIVKPEEYQEVTAAELRWMRTDVTTGMVISNVVAWFIIVTTASTLYRAGNKEISSAVQAAQALKPLAGDFAYVLFALGIIGTGLLAVPILAGSAAYAIAEAFRWQKGLYLSFRQAPGFYSVIIFSTLVGAGLSALGINPILALYYTAALNGIIAPPLLIMIMLISGNRKIMGRQVNNPISNTVGWLTTAVMTLAAIALLWTLRP